MRKLSINIVSESEFTVQGHGVHTAFLEHVAAMKQIATRQVFINTSQTTDFVHAHTVGPYSWRALRRVPRSRRIITAHIIPDSLVGSLKGGKSLHFFAKSYLKWFYNQASLVIAVSEEVATELARLGVRSRIVVIPNGVNLTKIKPDPNLRRRMRRKLSIPDGTLAVIGNGQIQPRKRFDSFTAAAEVLPETKFVWIGGMPFGAIGSNYKQMQALVKSAPNNVVVTGLLERPAALDHMQAGDVFFLPSAQENHPLAVLEAAALHLPVVLRDIPEYKTSFAEFAELGDDTSFAKIIKQLERPTKAARARRQAHKIAQRYNIIELTKQVDDLYSSLVEDQLVTA